MNDFQALLSIVFAIIVAVTLLLLPIIMSYTNKVAKLENIVKKLGDTKRISKALNIIWVILLIPSIITSFFALMGLALGGEAVLSWLSDFQIICIGISAWLFFAKPISIIICIILSFIFRKKGNLELSLLIQFTPVAILLSAYLFALVVLGLGLYLIAYTCAFGVVFIISLLIATKICRHKEKQ